MSAKARHERPVKAVRARVLSCVFESGIWTNRWLVFQIEISVTGHRDKASLLDLLAEFAEEVQLDRHQSLLAQFEQSAVRYLLRPACTQDCPVAEEGMPPSLASRAGCSAPK
jgi:hypothetical protein